MGLFDRASRVLNSDALTAATREADSPRPVRASVTSLYPPGMVDGQPWQYTAPVTRADAESIAACARSVDLVVSTVAGLPISRFTETGAPAPLGWLGQPEVGVPRWATFTELGRDLIFAGRAYLNPPVNGQGGSVIPCEYVTVTPGHTTDYLQWRDSLTIQGKPAPPGLLRFYGWHDGILNHGSRVLRTALALEGAAKRMADTPIPQTTLVNKSNYEMSDDEIDVMIAAHDKARAQNSTGYANAGVEPVHNTWSSAEQQLVEARQFSNGAVANLVGVPGHMVAGGTGSTSSLTYANVSQENRSFIDFGLNPLIKALEATLSQAVAPHFVRFNLGAMLRGNPSEIATLVAQLHPLGLISDSEARAWLDLVPGGTNAN